MAAAAVIALIVVVVTGQDNKLTCRLSAAGLGLVAEGVSKGRTPGEIASRAGLTIAGSTACEEMVAAFVEEPDKEVDVEVDDGAGDSLKESITGSELVIPPPDDPQPGDLTRSLECLGTYGFTNLLYEWCEEGLIEP